MIGKQIALKIEWDAKNIALVVGFWVIAFIIIMIKEHINTKKGEKGEDLAKVREVLKRLLPDYSTYTTAYAEYKTKSYRGRSTTTTYYHYAIAFKPGALYVLPIKYSGGEVSWQGNGALLTKDNLGKVEVDKGDVETALFSLDGKELCRFRVWSSNTRQDKYEPFNIQQKAEAEAYKTFIEGFVREVNGN
ncbi:MAG: hypothetical protein HDT33_05310 [Clostridiales bacterium]|nr:hypothetical protein [Clostridiales bacterium]